MKLMNSVSGDGFLRDGTVMQVLWAVLSQQVPLWYISCQFNIDARIRQERVSCSIHGILLFRGH